MLKYSFIEHPLLNVLKTLDQLIPNVKQAYALFSTIEKKIEIVDFKNNFHLSFQNKEHLIQKFRKEKRDSNWISKDMVSFIYENKEIKIQQLSFEDENKNNILCLKFLSPYDYLYDTLFIELSQSNVFQISKQGNELTIDQKKIIENILFHGIKSRIENEYNNLKTHELIINSFRNQQAEINKSFKSNFNLAKNYEQALDYFLASIIKKFLKEEHLEISFSPTCKKHIYNLNTDLDSIHQAILNAVNLIQNLSLIPTSKICLEAENIILNPTEIIEKSVVSNIEKHGNVIEMLDKYEAASILADQKGMKINGTTVARLCKPSITPAAITFNLKKYTNVINLLVNKYNHKWPTIKEHFKPLKNVLGDNNLKNTNKSRTA